MSSSKKIKILAKLLSTVVKNDIIKLLVRYKQMYNLVV